MQFFSTSLRTAALLVCLGVAGSAYAAAIGPTPTTAMSQADSSGTRTNIDENAPLVLAPGTYTASELRFFAVQSGTTTPFLAVNSDPANPNPGADIDSYRIIAIGDTFTAAPIAGTNVVQTRPYSPSATNGTFVLTATTKVFEGVTSSNNAIGFASGGSVYHDSTIFTPSVGATLSGSGNPDLGRTYAFQTEVVPEPASLGLLTFGALVFTRRWHRA